MKMTLFLLIAQSYLGDYYIYAAKGWHEENGVYYRAVDCSSYVLRCLQEVEFIKDDQDRSAQMLYDYLMLRIDRIYMSSIISGSILFFGKSVDAITHVAIALDKQYMIHAASGDRNTKTIKDAINNNAKVKINRINYRRDLVASLTLDI